VPTATSAKTGFAITYMARIAAAAQGHVLETATMLQQTAVELLIVSKRL
jgi:hypothetical protein